MKTRRIAILVALAVTCLTDTPARARFEMGSLRIGAGLGLRGSPEGTLFSASATFGVFVLQGLELHVSNLVQTGGDSPTVYLLTGGVRFIPLPDLHLTPYLAGEGGRLFIGDGAEDAWVAGAGGGLLYMLGPSWGIDLGVGYRWYFFPDEDPIGDWDVQVGLILVF